MLTTTTPRPVPHHVALRERINALSLELSNLEFAYLDGGRSAELRSAILRTKREIRSAEFELTDLAMAIAS